LVGVATEALTVRDVVAEEARPEAKLNASNQTARRRILELRVARRSLFIHAGKSQIVTKRVVANAKL
jgi:hypothetical protein